MKKYIRSATMSNRELAKTSKDSKVLARLANDEDEDVRWYVAQNPNTPAEALAQLANDEDAYTRENVALNPNTSAEALAQLANDTEWTMRWYVAKNSNTPVDILVQLANDEDEAVRKAAMDNPNCPVKSKKSKKSTKWPVANEWYNIESDEAFEDMWSTYLAGPEDDVNKELQIFPEPSVQGGSGGMFIFDESEEGYESFSIDYQDWCDRELEMAASSKSAKQYKEKYKKFVENLLDEYGWE